MRACNPNPNPDWKAKIDQKLNMRAYKAFKDTRFIEDEARLACLDPRPASDTRLLTSIRSRQRARRMRKTKSLSATCAQ